MDARNKKGGGPKTYFRTKPGKSERSDRNQNERKGQRMHN